MKQVFTAVTFLVAVLWAVTAPIYPSSPAPGSGIPYTSAM